MHDNHQTGAAASDGYQWQIGG